ncbi:MAG: HNH endonuclease [Bacteroidetes bacterium]|nr:HNH endonuclease [Bacteroidota bacterium]
MRGRVLVLNQSYEPLTVCSVQKAVILLYLHKADVVIEHPQRSIRTVSTCYPFPSVIRLSHYKRVPFKQIMLSRKNILRRDGHRCQYCGGTAPPLTVDHIIPRARGGCDTWENLVTACLSCNNRKRDHTPERAGMTLRSVPHRPSHVSLIVHSLHSVDEHWKPYLFIS